jgi:hypothetical protein
MPRIIEIYRGSAELGIPVRFTVGFAPLMVNGETAEDAPEVKSINFYETGAFKGQAYRGACYVVQFVDSDIRRIIPATDVIEIAYDSESEKIKSAKEDAAGTTELPDLED